MFERKLVDGKESEKFAGLTFCLMLVSVTGFAIGVASLDFSLAVLFAPLTVLFHQELRYWDLANKLNRMQKKQEVKKESEC